MTKRIRTVTVTHKGSLFLTESTKFYNFSDSPKQAIKREIDEFVECLGEEPGAYQVDFLADEMARLMDGSEMVALFEVSDEAIVNVGFLGNLDLNTFPSEKLLAILGADAE